MTGIKSNMTPGLTAVHTAYEDTYAYMKGEKMANTEIEGTMKKPLSGASPMKVLDSGTRRDFGTGSVRDAAAGKGRMDLIPMLALIELARHFEAGSAKYGDRNWEKGQPLSVYMDSGLRHAAKHQVGANDERHDLAALWNFMCMVETKIRIDMGLLPKSLDDLPYTLRNYHLKDAA